VELPSLKAAIAIAQYSDGCKGLFILNEYNSISDFFGKSFDILEGFHSKFGSSAIWSGS
jgi:hypothetical protein